jgi:hypothetical protein
MTRVYSVTGYDVIAGRWFDRVYRGKRAQIQASAMAMKLLANGGWDVAMWTYEVSI